MARPRPSRERMEVSGALARLPGWRAVEGREAIARSWRFADFAQAFAFMTRAALEAERLDHHPEWSNVYNRVEAALTTHDAGGVTGFDLALAQAMDAAAEALGAEAFSGEVETGPPPENAARQKP